MSDMDAGKAVRIDDEDLRSEYMTLPMELHQWGTREAEVYEAQQRCKLEFDQAEARLDSVHRALLREDGGKFTENMVKSAVIQDPEYVEAKLDCIEADAEVKRVKAVVHALNAKMQMLISLGATQRAEAKAGW
jgi:hypothetical protein